MQRPKASVCVPTYNGSAFLAQTLTSISKQTFEDYEVIIVDDQSWDDTLAIAEQYAANDARVHVFRNNDRAGSSARNANRCLTHASGEWIKFLFQDDLMAPDCLARMVEAGRSGRFVLCWHDYLFAPDVDAEVRAGYENLPSLKAAFPKTYAGVEDFCNAVLRHWNINFMGPTSASFIHRDCFTAHGPFSSEIVTFPDLECWIRLGSREGLAIVPERLVTFRVHNTSISARLRDGKARQFQHELEPVLLLLYLARSPNYESMRMHARRQVPPVDPDLLLARAALSARWKATDARYRQRNRSALDHWTAFCRQHPELLDVLREADAAGGIWPRLKHYLKTRL
ncbi:MAG TPA: glycosyltransferase family A protein [Burkholderiales bacterium]